MKVGKSIQPKGEAGAHVHRKPKPIKIILTMVGIEAKMGNKTGKDPIMRILKLVRRVTSRLLIFPKFKQPSGVKSKRKAETFKQGWKVSFDFFKLFNLPQKMCRILKGNMTCANVGSKKRGSYWGDGVLESVPGD